MHQLWVIAKKDIRESFRSRSTYIYIVFLFLLTFSTYSTYSILINQTAAGNPSQKVLIETSRLFLNNITYTLPMWYAILICTIFATYSVVVEKAKRNIESLMATPVSLNKIWMGKTLAVTLPSVVIALAVSVVAFIIMNVVLVIPRTGSFVMPGTTAILSALILVPLLIFAVTSLVIYMQLIISNPRIANFAFTAVFLLFFFGSSFLTGRGFIVDFSLIYLGLIIICGAVAYLLSRTLTKEKVLLSSKE